MPSLQQLLEGRRKLPKVSGLCPGTAGLPDRMAGPAGLEGHSSSTSGFPAAQTQGHSLGAQARQGVTTRSTPGKGELKSGQWVSLVSRLRGFAESHLGNGLAFYWQGTPKPKTAGERR